MNDGIQQRKESSDGSSIKKTFMKDTGLKVDLKICIYQNAEAGMTMKMPRNIHEGKVK